MLSNKYPTPTGSNGHSEDSMRLQRDDWVKTGEGKVGKIVHISRLTVFVAFAVPGDEDRIDGFLESQLTKVERPERQ
jgi:hypothetical protein